MNAATVIVGEAAALIVIAPLAGVALASGRLHRLRLAAAALAATLALSTLWAGGVMHIAWPTTLATHLTLFTAALALGAVGAWCGSIFRDPLDAVAWSAAVVLVATCGLFATGSLSADLPTPVVNAVLLANPIIAVASAANIDLLRSDFLYQLSPIAHRRFDYPAWYLAVACFSVVALMAAAGVARARRREEVW